MEIDRYNRQLQLKEDGIKELKQVNDNLKSKCHLLETELESVQQTNTELRQDLEARQQQVEELFSAQGGKMPSAMQIEIQQLKDDNRRLFDMIRHTKEFKEFAGFVEDSGGAVRSLKNENQA